MALISIFSRLVNGVQRQIDLSTNTIVVQAIQINGVLLSSSASGNAGSKLVGDDNSYSNFTPTAATVKGALAGIDAALSGSGSTQLDGTFKIENTSDPTKILVFDASGIATGTTRSLKMSDFDTDLANLVNANISASAAIALTKLAALTNHNRALVSDASGFISESAVTATELGYLSGVTSAIQTQLNGKAATDLSNLASTAVNAAIIASADNLRDLGSSSIAWRNIYANKIGTGSNSNLIDVLNQRLNDSSNASALNWTSRILQTAAGITTLDWSGANVSLNSHKLVNVTDPTSAQDAATKFYVDNLVAGLSWKTHARVASVANVSVASAPASIDGVALVANDRVLLKDQTTASENGIYVFSAAASPLTRSTDMDSWAEVVSAVLMISEGTVNAGSKWVNQNIDGGTLGTTAITFAAFSIAGTVNGTGTTNYVAYWSGTSTLTAEQYLSAARGGLAADASAFTGVLKAVSGVFSASQIVNADVAAGAAIAYSKLNLAGSIVNADIATGAAIAYSKLALTNSVLLADLTSNSVDENKIVSTTFSASGAISGGSGTKVAWLPDNSSLEISSNAARIKSTAYDQVTITGGSGSAAAVQSAPANKRVLVAGQSFSANTSYAVRWAVTANGETAGRVYAADITTSSFDLFYVIGMASSTSAVSAGQNITVTSLGSFSLGSSDSAFAAASDGTAVFLAASGAFSTTAPSTSGQAVVRIGVIQVRSATPASNIIDVAPQVIGVF